MLLSGLRRRVMLGILSLVTLLLLATLGTTATTTLQVMDWKLNETPGTQAWFQQVKETFEAEHPGVEIEYITAPWGDVYREKILVSAAVGAVPDAVSLSVIWARELWDAGVLRNLNPYIDRTPELHPRNFIPATQVYNQIDGNVFGITNAMDVSALLYNCDIFVESGLDTDPFAIESWDELAAVLKKLTVVDSSGRTTRYGLAMSIGLEAYSSWLNANGGSFYKDNYTRSAFGSQQGLQAAEFILSLHRQGLLGGSLPQRTAAMSRGQNSTAYFLVKDAPGLNYNITSFPKGPSGKQRGATVWGNMYSIPKDSKNPELAWEFIKYYASLRGNIDIFESLGYVTSPRLDFYRSRQWVQGRTEAPWMPMIPEIAYVGGVYPFLEYNKLVQQVWNPFMYPALTGSVAIQGAFAQGSVVYDRILSEMGR